MQLKLLGALLLLSAYLQCLPRTFEADWHFMKGAKCWESTVLQAEDIWGGCCSNLPFAWGGQEDMHGEAMCYSRIL